MPFLKRYGITFLFILLFTGISEAQQKNAVLIEAGGHGGYGTISYRRVVIEKNNFDLSAQIGFSTLFLFDYKRNFNPDLIFPLQGVFTHKIYKSHHLYTNLGMTASSTTYADFPHQSVKRDFELHPIWGLGYFYRPAEARFAFNIAYTPIYRRFDEYIHWAGIGGAFFF